MDWKKITDTMTPYVNKAKEFGKKAAKFTEEQIQTTPLFIKTQSEYDNFLMEKRAIIIAYEDTGVISDEIRFFSSIWLTRAFIDIAKFRMVNITEFPDLAHAIGFVGPVDMRVRFEGEETICFTNIDEIKQWWKSPYYTKTETPEESKVETPIDPLTGK